MNGEISRKSFVDFINRMQVVIETVDGRTHVLNFANYASEGHSHIVYKNGKKEYIGSYGNRECYEHSYSGNMADYYNASRVSSFPYTFEQVYDLFQDLSIEELAQLKEYVLKSTEEEIVRSR